MLVDIVSRAIGRNARFGFAADQLIHRSVQGFAHDVPKRQIHAADGVHADPGAVVAHAGAPENIPVPLDIEGIFPHQQLSEVLFDQRPAARPARPIAFDSLIGADLDEEAWHLARIRHEQRAHGLIFGIDRHGARHFHAVGGPRIGRRTVGRERMLRLRIHQTHRSDLEITLFVPEYQRRSRSPRRQPEKRSPIHTGKIISPNRP
ncbi:MAG: hypothetical protein ABSB15_21735 [Bryobacteraceae bacterium]